MQPPAYAREESSDEVQTRKGMESGGFEPVLL